VVLQYLRSGDKNYLEIPKGEIDYLAIYESVESSQEVLYSNDKFSIIKIGN
jgi:hypothetical protein